MAYRTLIATMGFDERHVLPSLRLMPYDRLVLVAGRDTFRSAGFRRLKVLEPGLRTVRVDPFDLAIPSGRSEGRFPPPRGTARSGSAAAGGRRILTTPPIRRRSQEEAKRWN